MKAKEENRISAFPLFGAFALGGGTLFYFVAAALAGGSVLTAARLLLFLAAFAVCVLGTGEFCIRKLAPGVQGIESAVLAFLPGCGCVFAGYALIWALGALLPFLRQSPAWFLLPAWLWGGYEWIFRIRRRRASSGNKNTSIGSFLFTAEGALLALVLGAILAVSAVWGVLPSAGADQLKVWTYNQDQLWSAGNAAAVQFGLPLQDMRVAGAFLHYHFLNDVTAGLLALGTGASAWAGFCWFWNLPVLVLSVLGLFCLGRRFAPKAPWLAALLPFAVFFCSAVSSTLPTALFTNANAQATALLALCAGLLLIQNTPAVLDLSGGVRWFFFSVLCAASLCMLKSTIGALLGLAVLAAVLVGAVLRQVKSGHLLLLAGFGAGFFAVYTAVLRLATNNLIFTSLSNLKKLPAAYLGYFALPLLAVYVLGLIYSALHLKQLSFSLLAVNAFAIGGMLAYVLYEHYSFSQVYFALAAVPAALLASFPAAQAACEYLGKHGSKAALPRVMAGLLAVCMLGMAGMDLYYNQNYLRLGAQAALRCLNLRTFEKSETTMTADDWAAAQWLKENTPADAVFATNRNNKLFDAAEGTFHFYTAASERRCYLESYRYALDYDRSYDEIRRRLEKVSDQMFYHLSEDEAFALAKKEGIDYLVVSRLVPAAPAWAAQPVYANEDVAIYAVP
jgi:hypothetical protein